MTISPEARILASFTFVASLVLGSWTQLLGLGQEFLGFSPGGAGEIVVMVVIAVLGAVAALLAQQAIAGAAAEWARHLAGATVLLAGLVAVGALFRIIATL